jgi:Methyltransferase domain
MIERVLKKSIRWLDRAIGIAEWPIAIFRSRRKIEQYRRDLGPGGEFRVVLGGHWSNHPGWLVLAREDQDLCRPLVFADSSVNVIFTEHVIEHVDFLHCIGFFREAKRVLAPGGVLRIVCPMIEQILAASFDDELGGAYINNCVKPTYKVENDELVALGLRGVADSPRTFFTNALFLKHEHKFIWSADLLVKVLRQIGFSRVQSYGAHEGGRAEYCINRRRRGQYFGNDFRADAAQAWSYDAESLAVEATR